MTVTTLTVTVVSVASLYRAVFNQHRLRLIEEAQIQVSFIEAVAKFDSGPGPESLTEKPNVLIWRRIYELYKQLPGFGKSGEFVIARKQGSQIEFILTHHQMGLGKPGAIPFDSKWAQPMRLALLGESGAMTGLDYSGTAVLAAFEPIDMLGLGLVTKIDLSEIRAPFIRAGVIAFLAALLAIILAGAIFRRITNRVMRQIGQQAETFKTLVETARESIILIDVDGVIQFVNPAAEALFGYRPGELVGGNISRLMPAPHSAAHDGYIKKYLQTGVGKIIGTGRQLTGLRKDGSLFTMHLSIGDIKLRHARLFTGVIMDLSEQQSLHRRLMELPAQEQQRIGQELHDGIGQQLTGLSMLATSLANKASKSEHELSLQLVNGLNKALSEVRALSRGLMPVEINLGEFNTAIQNLCMEIEQQSKTPIRLQIDQHLQLIDDTAAMHLYRITQEAINNAIKHARASQIDVLFKIEQGQGLLEVRDNGRGLPDCIEQSKGIGIQIMKYRSGLFNSEFFISSSNDGGGTVVSCRFPLKPIQAAG